MEPATWVVPGPEMAPGSGRLAVLGPGAGTTPGEQWAPCGTPGARRGRSEPRTASQARPGSRVRPRQATALCALDPDSNRGLDAFAGAVPASAARWAELSARRLAAGKGRAVRSSTDHARWVYEYRDDADAEEWRTSQKLITA